MILPWWVRPAVILAVAAAAYGYGRLDQAQSEQAKRDQERIREMEQIAEWSRQSRALGARETKERERIRVVFETIEKAVDRIVERPVYRDCALDDDGLRAWNEANSAQASAGGEPSGAVPASAGAGSPDHGGGAAEPR